MSKDNETIGVYANQAEDYAALVSDLEHNETLAGFMELLTKDAHVLDLGCGPGWAAAIMARNGLKVTATDATPEMVEMAAKYEGVDARCATFDDVKETATYDGVWANFSLLHASRADLPRYISALSQALRATGVLHIAMKTGTGEKRDSLGRFYTYVTQNELEGLLKDAGCTPFFEKTGEERGLDGTMAPWIAIWARKDRLD
ncbi:MAG: class I SAM-dependent methyltransferase [Pseudomonadota bacterium]